MENLIEDKKELKKFVEENISQSNFSTRLSDTHRNINANYKIVDANEELLRDKFLKGNSPHAVLSYIISMIVNLIGGVGVISISIVRNLIIIVLEGMIVSIQVVCLQYYEFFSKFFSETGREFCPFAFKYQKA